VGLVQKNLTSSRVVHLEQVLANAVPDLVDSGSLES